MQKYNNKERSYGFSLIELMVSISLYIIVVMVVGSAFLGLVSSYRRISSLRLNMDNLGASLDSIVRGIKTGKTYHCGFTNGHSALASVRDCLTGDDFLAFESVNGNTTGANHEDDQVIYALGPRGSQCFSGQICRSLDSGDTWLAITAPPPSITISSLRFFVVGTDPSDKIQPRVVIVIQGTSGSGDTVSTFSIQTTVTQKEPDTL